MAAQAVTVNVATPGTLSTLVGKSETQLTVTGKINALDFDYIRELSALRSLDLSGASVEAYKGDATATSALEYPANVLPDCALLGVPATTLLLPAGIVKIDQGAVGNSAADRLAAGRPSGHRHGDYHLWRRAGDAGNLLRYPV